MDSTYYTVSGSIYTSTMLDWKMDWYGGIDYGMDYGIYSNIQLYCVAICLLPPCSGLH